MDLGRLVAPPGVCSGQAGVRAPVPEQEQAMRCMTNYAREHAGRQPLANTPVLGRSARDKSADIVRCDSFSHFACGRPFTFWMRRVGYIPARCWRAGENLAWGSGDAGSAQAIFRAWIRSPEHRDNILGPYRQIGVGLITGSLEGHASAHVWTQHFGSHCGGSQSRPAPVARLSGFVVARRPG
jgi:uncharacterized protein YkwD